MEFVNGRTLKEVLAAEQRIQPRRALEMIADICAALEFSHRHGIIHRDIKPGNVMLTQNGQVKVMDFGIARALASGATTMTQTSAVIGTAQYLSPEQARGEAVDARSDVYAAGCVLFELLCGHPPFVGDSPVSVAYQHVREDPRAPSDINRDVTPPIDAIVLKALSKNPLNRYQSAGEMRADLLRAATGRPVMATPVLREAETVAMAPPATAVRRPGPPTGPMPARVGDPRRRKASAWVVAALSALGVLAIIALVAGLLQQRARDEKIQVPTLVGQPAAAAQLELQKLGLVATTKAVKDDECTLNNVTDQNPEGGAEVEAKSSVELTVCAGANTVLVPGNLVGQPQEAVVAQLQELKLRPQVAEIDNGAPEGQVLAVDKAGTNVPIDTRIKVTVSRGNMIKVPDVVGQSRETAEVLLTRAGFDVQVREGQEVTDPQNADKVTGQAPGAEKEAKKGSRVTITVTVLVEEPSPEPSDPTTPPPGNGGSSGEDGGLSDILPPLGGNLSARRLP
jgi:eukaryotic-like serine/threonine-protein kinase